MPPNIFIGHVRDDDFEIDPDADAFLTTLAEDIRDSVLDQTDPDYHHHSAPHTMFRSGGGFDEDILDG